jgi:hypothetical protein
MNRWAVMGRSFRCGLHSREGYRWLADLRGVRNSDRQRPGPRLLRQRLPEARAAVRQQFAKHRAVAAGLVFAAAARSTSWCHASAPPADRASAAPSAHPFSASKAQTKPFQSPSPRVVLRHQLRAGREVGKPNIEPVVERTAFLPNATAQCGIRAPLATRGFTQADDPQGRDATIAVRARAGLLFVFCPAGPMWANG